MPRGDRRTPLRERNLGPAIGNTAGRTPWGNEADIQRYKTGHLPGFGIVGHPSPSISRPGYPVGFPHDTRNVPRQTETPNFRPPYGAPGQPSFEVWRQQTETPNLRPPYGAPGQPSFEVWRQQIDPYPYDRNPRRPNINPRGMRGGLGGLQEQAAIDPSDWRILQQIIKAGGNPDDYLSASSDYDTGLGSTGEYLTAELGVSQPMDWQTDPYERLSLDELIGLGASEEQIAQYLGIT